MYTLFKTLAKTLVRRQNRIDWQNIQRVLVIRHRFIGDTILLEPFLRDLAQNLPPPCKIDVLVAKGSGELLEGHPAVNRLIYFESTSQVLRELKAANYSLAFVLKRSWSSALLALKAGIPLRVGFATEGRSATLTHPLPYRKDLHEAENFLQSLSAVGLETTPPHTGDWSFLTEAHPLPSPWRDLIQRYHEEGRYCILWHAVASNTAKAWPARQWDSFFKALDARKESLPALAFFVVGSEKDSTYYHDFQAQYPLPFPLHVSCGQLSLPQSMSLIHHLDASIGIDSGPMHMAGTAGHPLLLIFGPSAPWRWTPLSDATVTILQSALPCQPCQLSVPCHFDSACLRHLSPLRVASTFVKLLESLPLPLKSGASKNA
ncbi:MAG: glycosyltransferase family 9 protein [Vampirovibrio sp.]